MFEVPTIIQDEFARFASPGSVSPESQQSAVMCDKAQNSYTSIFEEVLHACGHSRTIR